MKEDITLKLGALIKQKRIEKKTTLDELATKIGVTKGMLSQVEHSRTVPSVSVLMNLIAALNIDFNELFTDLQKGFRLSKTIIKRAADYEAFKKENAKGFYYRRMLSTKVNGMPIDIVLLRLSRNARRAKVKTDAYEFKYILQGNVEYIIGDEVYLLNEGDCIFFDARQPHTPRNKGAHDALMLIVYMFDAQ